MATPTWASRILDLKATGLTLTKIGELAGLSLSSVSDIVNGRTESPRGEAAIKLFQLHAKRCPPRVNRPRAGREQRA